jgi:hypothetical protein
VHGAADGGAGHPSELALLRAYEPVICYPEGELFLPTAVGRYVERCSLWIHEPGTPPRRPSSSSSPAH